MFAKVSTRIGLRSMSQRQTLLRVYAKRPELKGAGPLLMMLLLGAFIFACSDDALQSDFDGLMTNLIPSIETNPSGADKYSMELCTLQTDDQRMLDSRLVEIAENNDFTFERAWVLTMFLAGHGWPVSDEAGARLANAIDELVGGAIAEAVNGNPARPRVYWLGAESHSAFGLDVPGTRWAYDNPDNVYRTIPIDPEGAYVVHGRRQGNGPADMSFSLIDDTVTQSTLAYLDGKTLRIDPEGYYDITIDPDPADGRPNHVQNTAGAVQLFIRSNLGDWASEEHDELSVERLDLESDSADELSDDDIVAQVSSFLLKGAPVYGLGLLGFKTMVTPVNTFPAPSSTQTPGALITQANSIGHFRIADDEALVITFDPGGADYWIVPVTDPWMLGIDPGGHQSSLNRSQAVADADGRYTFVVAKNDPGVHNWLDTVGLNEGTMMARWQRLPEDGGNPAITAQLVEFDDLPALLPADTVYVTEIERCQALAERQAAYERRFL